MRGDLFEVRLKTQRRGWGLTAEADGGDEVPLGQLKERQPVRQRRRPVLEGPNHPRC